MRSTHVDPPIKPDDFVDAQKASELLGIKLQTLYAYASRGLIASVPGTSGRARLYSRADLERLRTRAGGRPEPSPLAVQGPRWSSGDLTIDTSLTVVDASAGPHYRGQAAVALAEQGASFEAVAELLWGGSLPGSSPSWPRPAFEASKLSALVPADAPPITSLLVLVPALAAVDSERFAAPRDADIARARLLLGTMATFIGPTEAPAATTKPAVKGASRTAVAAKNKAPRSKGRPPTGVAASLATSLGASAEAASLLDQALVLTADEELDAPAFTARVAAGAGADLYACLAAALNTASGPQHGGACDRVEALVLTIEKPERARAVVTERVRRGEPVPGFGHPLFPAGDPRAALLLAGVERLGSKSVALRSLLALVKAMADTDRGRPTLDTALVALCLALGARPGTASALRVLGRSAGWVAHVLEQRDGGPALRGRGRYVGPAAAATPEAS